MTQGGGRIIKRTASTSRQEIGELLVGVLAAELAAPSQRLWLVSPWLRDVDLLDNRSAAFRGIGPAWGRRRVRLFEVLGELARRGCELVVATRPEDGVEEVEAALGRDLGEGPASHRLRLLLRPQLHTKGLLGDDFCISGSMNFTNNGIQHLDEMVTYTTDPAQVGALRIEFAQEYGEAGE